VDEDEDVDVDVDVDVDLDLEPQRRGQPLERDGDTALTSSCEQLLNAWQLSRSSEVPGHVSSNSYVPPSSHARGPSSPFPSPHSRTTRLQSSGSYSRLDTPLGLRSPVSSRHRGRLVHGIGTGSMDHAGTPSHEVVTDGFEEGLGRRTQEEDSGDDVPLRTSEEAPW
jgi:hypothetical protein